MQNLFTYTNPPVDLQIEDLGTLNYLDTHALQLEQLAKRKKDEVADTLFFVEHPAVYTYGRKHKDQPMLPGGVLVERGGEATYHNPGQIVFYPILKLRKYEQDVPKFIRALEEVVILTLKEFGISSERREGATGVWIAGKNKKIASLGVALSAWTSYHGVALNVNNDLSGFFRINPCGFNAEVMTSMQAEGVTVSEAQVKAVLTSYFKQIFNRK